MHFMHFIKRVFIFLPVKLNRGYMQAAGITDGS
jgi:hypothetical protein